MRHSEFKREISRNLYLSGDPDFVFNFMVFCGTHLSVLYSEVLWCWDWGKFTEDDPVVMS